MKAKELGKQISVPKGKGTTAKNYILFYITMHMSYSHHCDQKVKYVQTVSIMESVSDYMKRVKQRTITVNVNMLK